MKKLAFYFLFSVTSIFLFTSCEEEEMPASESNLVEVAQAEGFSVLAAAITKAGLLEALQGETEYTVFAPTNEAFSNLLEVIGQTSIDDVPASVLEQILLYHVVPGMVKSDDIESGNIITLEGSNLVLDAENGITVNGVDVITPFDVEASNGIIHTIDEVLVPATIAQFVNTVLEPAYFNESFSTLVQAAVKAEVVETLLTTPNLTIFAPDNAAFEASGINPEDIDAETLAAVLTYHVVGSKVLSNAIPSSTNTVNGNEIYFSLVSSGNFINGSTSIVAVDIESGSGVVHVIDNVLLPPSGNLVETTIALSANGEFTSLIAALTRTANEGSPDQNLLTVLSGTGPFTVFAPTNAAFQALLDSNEDWSSLNDIPLNTLISVLTYHVVPGRTFDKDIEGTLDVNNQLPTAFGQNITVDLNELSINQTSKIIDVNYISTNGVIHVIDNVLLP